MTHVLRLTPKRMREFSRNICGLGFGLDDSLAAKTLLLLFLLAVISVTASAAEPIPTKWIIAKAYVIPKETAPDGEGYFSIVEGHNRRLYIGTHANAVNSWLVEFNPAAERMKVVVDAHKSIGTDLKGFAAQAKIHTRNNVGKRTGRIYFGTKQGYPSKDENRKDYPGGYPMVYAPKTGRTRVYPIPIPHQGIISVTPDESRGLAYISTCSDERPIDSTHFLVLNLESGEYRDLMDCRHMYAFIVVDFLGRAYHPILGGDIARYDPATGKLAKLKQTIDGRPPSADSYLVGPDSHVINWEISPNGKTLYAQPMIGNGLYAYDLTAEGGPISGRSLGALLPGAGSTDCRAMCVGPAGTVWCAVTEKVDGIHLLHLVRYRPGDRAPVDLGAVAIGNPDFTQFTDNDGNPLPSHGGFTKLKNGKTVTRYVIQGVCEATDGSVYILALRPYCVLQIRASDTGKKSSKNL